MSWLKVVGIGSGNKSELTFRAYEIVSQSDIIVGYKKYVELLREIFPEKEYFMTAMGGELERVSKAIEFYKMGKNTCLVSSGDAGIYGLSGLLFEYLKNKKLNIDIEVVPGISALSLANSLLGAPLMMDFAVVSLSDYLVDFEEILRRVKSALESDFVLVIYNPTSSVRKENFSRALNILLSVTPSERPLGIVKNAYRKDQMIFVTQLGKIRDFLDKIDMNTILIIGSSKSFICNGKIITSRGYNL